MKNKEPLWYRFYSKAQKNVRYTDDNCYENLKNAAEKYSLRSALKYCGSSVTYEELLKKTDEAALAFYNKGIKSGDVVILMLPNIPEGVYCIYALNKIGAVACMIHPRATEYETEIYISEIESSGSFRVKAIVTLDVLYPKLQKIVLKSNIEFAVICRISDSAAFPYSYIERIKNLKLKIKQDYLHIGYNEFIKSYSKYGEILFSDEYPENKKPEAESTAVIIYSGGSATGLPRAVKLSSYNLNAAAAQIYALYKKEFDERELSIIASLPMFHGFGLGVCVHSMLCSGACTILLPSFSADVFALAVKKYRPSFIAGVPTMYESLAESKKTDKADLSCLAGVFSGGDSLSEKTREKFNLFLKEHNSIVKLNEGYGLSETSGVCCISPAHCIKDGSIGIPLSDMQMKIVDIDTNEECKAYGTGEIWIKGPSVMQGYINSDCDNEKAFSRDENNGKWLRTGDMGYTDSDGYFYYTQRIKRILKVCGYPVYPRLVEKTIEKIDGVDVCCAVGTADEYSMEKIKLYVKCKGETDREILKNKIVRECKDKLSKWSQPGSIEFVEKIPRTRIGKVDYNAFENGTGNSE